MRQQVKARTWDSYNRNLELHVLPTLGGRHLQALSPRLLNALCQLRENGRPKGPADRGLSPKSTRQSARSSTTQSTKICLQRNPATRAKPPRPQGGTSALRFWTPEELTRFPDHVRDHRWFPVWFPAITGMRRGELLGLRWQDIDFGHARLAVRQALVSIAYRTSLSTPKSHRSRVIDLDVETLGVLRNRFAESGDPHPSELVFTADDGEPIHPESVRVVFERLHRHAGLQRIRFHELRDTHATIALHAGVAVKVIRERLGHATPAVTLQQYAHVIPAMQAEAASQITHLIDDGRRSADAARNAPGHPR